MSYPVCDLCRKTVDRVTTHHDPYRQITRLVAHCHGNTHTYVVHDELIEDEHRDGTFPTLVFPQFLQARMAAAKQRDHAQWVAGVDMGSPEPDYVFRVEYVGTWVDK